MEFLLAKDDQGSAIKENFIKDIFLKIPELDTCKFLIDTIEEIFRDLEIDMGLLAKFTNISGENRGVIKLDKEKERGNKYWFETLKNNNSHLNLNNLSNFPLLNFNYRQNMPSLTHGSKRKASYDKSENSLDKYKEEEKNNFTIDKYFKPIVSSTKLSFSNLNLCEKKNEARPNILVNSGYINKNREISSNMIISKKDYPNSLKEFESLKTNNSKTSVKSVYSEDMERMSMNSNSKKNSSLFMDVATQNSNFFNTEYSKISYESNLKKININTSVSTPCHGFPRLNPNISSAKSNNFSQNSMQVSQFSLNPANTFKNNNCHTLYSNSFSEAHSIDNSLSQNNLLPLGISLYKHRNLKFGNYSLIAEKTSNVAKSRKNSECNLKTITTNGNSNKKLKKGGATFIQKILEKCGKNSNGKSSEKNKIKKIASDRDRKKLKSILDGSFYIRQNYLIKSPDAVEKRSSDRNLEKTRDSTEKIKEKTRQNQETPISDNKLLNNKRHSERNDERRLTRAVAKNEEFQAKRATTRSAEKSITDDEVLVYQTPIKNNQVISAGNLKTPPGVTTRKNLYNLFQQIDKSA